MSEGLAKVDLSNTTPGSAFKAALGLEVAAGTAKVYRQFLTEVRSDAVNAYPASIPGKGDDEIRQYYVATATVPLNLAFRMDKTGTITLTFDYSTMQNSYASWVRVTKNGAVLQEWNPMTDVYATATRDIPIEPGDVIAIQGRGAATTSMAQIRVRNVKFTHA